MNPTNIAICLAAIASLVWAVAWWDIQRRRGDDQEHYRELRDGMRHIGEAMAHFQQQSSERIAALEKNPATMQATRERMDVLEGAMKNLRDQTMAEIEDIRRRNTTMLTRVNARGVGTRPNG